MDDLVNTPSAARDTRRPARTARRRRGEQAGGEP
jgi:hypothetical protein